MESVKELSIILAMLGHTPTGFKHLLRCCCHVCSGHMIFEDGFYHADPHPGNILLRPDGKMGLIDFGQCKRLTDMVSLEGALREAHNQKESEPRYYVFSYVYRT